MYIFALGSAAIEEIRNEKDISDIDNLTTCSLYSTFLFSGLSLVTTDKALSKVMDA